MKLFLFAVVVLLPGWALADSPTTPATSTAPNTQLPQPTEELKVMTERLGLSQAQQDQIAPILVMEAKDRKAIEDNKTLSPQQKQIESGMVHRAALQQIKAVFTPQQMVLIEQGQDHPGDEPDASVEDSRWEGIAGLLLALWRSLRKSLFPFRHPERSEANDFIFLKRLFRAQLKDPARFTVEA